MKIGIIGAGNIGSTLAELFAKAGYDVMVSNSRSPETLQGLVDELGDKVQAGTAEDAAAFGEVVIEAIPFGHYRDLPAAQVGNKIFVTASNYYPERDGKIELGDKSESELVAEHVGEARVVKAFNTIYYKHLQTQGDMAKALEDRRVIFIAGDDAEAKETVSNLIEAIGFGAVDTGSLHHSKMQQPGTDIYTKDITVKEARTRLEKTQE